MIDLKQKMNSLIDYLDNNQFQDFIISLKPSNLINWHIEYVEASIETDIRSIRHSFDLFIRDWFEVDCHYDYDQNGTRFFLLRTSLDLDYKTLKAYYYDSKKLRLFQMAKNEIPSNIIPLIAKYDGLKLDLDSLIYNIQCHPSGYNYIAEDYMVYAIKNDEKIPVFQYKDVLCP